MAYTKIDDIEQMKGIDNGYLLKTKLQNPDHIQKDDVLHKFNCKLLIERVKSRAIMPKNNQYFHIESSDQHSLKLYSKHKTCNCWNNI